MLGIIITQHYFARLQYFSSLFYKLVVNEACVSFPFLEAYTHISRCIKRH